VKIKPRNEIFNDIIRDSKKHPTGWLAAIGKEEKSLSNDCYIFHKNSGIYCIKEYYKNPYELKGVGSKIARNIDDDIQQIIDKNHGDFGIIQGNIHKIMRNINNGIRPEKIVSEAIKGNDLGIKMPLKGKVSFSAKAFDALHSTFSDKQKKLDSRFDKIVTQDGIYTSYG
jgi:hypothetical protein